MPLYTARVGMARRTGVTPHGGVTPWVIEEVLIDSIQASSKRKAKRLIMEHAKKHTGYRFPLTIDREVVPDPIMIELVRLNKEGKPVDSKFSMEAGVTIKPLASSLNTQKKKASTGAANKTGATRTYTQPKQYPLADPMTEEFIKTVMETHDAA